MSGTHGTLNFGIQPITSRALWRSETGIPTGSVPLCGATRSDEQCCRSLLRVNNLEIHELDNPRGGLVRRTALMVYAKSVSLRGDLYESEPRQTVEASRGIYCCWMEDVERLDEMIGRYLPIALSAAQDFDRALRAAHVILELIETQTTLLESYIGGAE